MGRKLDLGSLTEEEEKVILQVIKRDYTVRKVESDRIGQLSRTVEDEEQKQQEVVKEAVKGEVPMDTLCAKCGSKFMWLINPKNQCSGCDLYFCKNKIDCIVYDKLTDKCFCNACLKHRELHALAGNWFYSKLKGKFRRHGGAKVSRELQKRNKSRKSESDSSPGPPKKPARLTLGDDRSAYPASSIDSTPAPSLYRHPSDRSYDSSSITTLEEGRVVSMVLHGQIEEKKEKESSSDKSDDGSIKQEYDVAMDAVIIETTESAPLQQSTEIEVQTDSVGQKCSIEIQTEDFDSKENEADKLPAIKEELEAAISKLLLPKLEELKRSQSEHESELERQKKIDESVKLAEEMIDKALERAREKHSDTANDQSEGQISQRSSMRETGTMTETSDSEMESLSSHSMTGRNRSRDIPLSERLGSLSPDSLRQTLDLSQNSSGSSITQGVVLQKDQLVARADIDNTLGQILDEQGVIVHGNNSPQEFSTELKFTAVGVGGQRRRRLSTEELSDSDSDHSEKSQKYLTENENWSVPEVQRKPSNFGKAPNVTSSNSMMSLQNGVASPYDHLREGESDSDDREHVAEEQVLASVVRRPDSTISPQALVSNRVELAESLPAKKPHLPVDIAVNSQLLRSLSEDLDNEEHMTRKAESTPTTPPVDEEIIQAVDRGAIEFQAPSTTEIVTEETEIYEEQPSAKKRILIPPPRTLSTDSELSAIPEAEREERSQTSESDSSETSSNDSHEKAYKSSHFLKPTRHSVASRNQNPTSSELSYDNDLIADNDEFGDKMADILAAQQRDDGQNMEEGLDAQQRDLYEPEQREITIDTSVKTDHRVQESFSSVSDDESTLGSELREKQIEESAVAMRMVNNKSIEILTDTIQTIEEVKGHSSSESSDSESDDESSKHDSSDRETIHKMNVAEEEIYKNAARTYAMEERLDQIEQDTENLDGSAAEAIERLKQLEQEVEFAGQKEAEIRQGVKSIDEIMQELRGAGLKAERGGFKRQSLDSKTAELDKEHQKKPSRYSLPSRTPTTQRPVNAANDESPIWMKNTFKVVPMSSSAPPLEEPNYHSTPKAKSTSSSDSSRRSRSGSSSSGHSGRNIDIIEATIAAPVHASNKKSNSSGSATPTHRSRSAMPTRTFQSPNSAHSSKSTTPKASPHSTPSHSRTHSIEGIDNVSHVQVPVELPKKESSISSHSATSLHSVKSASSLDSKSSSAPSDKVLEAKIPAHVIIPQKDPSISSNSASSIHSSSSARSAKSDHSSKSIHSANSNNSSDSRTSSEKEYHVKQDIRAPVIIPLKKSSISSHSLSSIHSTSSAEDELKGPSYVPGLSAAELEESRIPTPVPRRKKETLQIGESAMLPAAVPREKKESISSSSSSDDEGTQQTIEESFPAKNIQAVAKEFEGKEEKLDGKEAKIETDESGAEYTEPLITQGMNPGSEGEKKKIVKKRKPLVHQSISTSSDSSFSNEKPRKKDKSKYKKDDSWMLRRESDVDSDTSSSSKHSVGTGRSSKSGMFHNLSAAEQREMARIALMHLPETAIAEERYKTKTIKFVRREDSDAKSPPPSVKSEVLSAVEAPVTQKAAPKQESAPPKPPHRHQVATAQVHVGGDSPRGGMTLGEARKLLQKELNVKVKTDESGAKYVKREDGWKGTSFNTENEKSNLRNSFDGRTIRKIDANGNAELIGHGAHLTPTDLDRTQVVRGSITMRGGKAMVLTTSPDGKEKAEFKDF